MKSYHCLYILLSMAAQVLSTPEEYYQPSLMDNLNSVNAEDEPIYTYLDIRSEQEKPEARRRSILDKNFARFGRGGNLPAYNYDYDLDYGMANFARPTRPGNEKTDHFIRFGRGSNAARYKMSRVLRNNKDSFVRFGRNLQTSRTKRSMRKRKAASRDFLRFGRGRADEFMRFGRDRPSEMNSTIIETGKNDLVIDGPLMVLLKKIAAVLRKHRGGVGRSEGQE